MDRKKSGRMTAVPQLGPEVFIDDREPTRAASSRSAMLSPTSPRDPRDARVSFVTHGLDGTAHQRRGTESSLGGFIPPGSHGMMSGNLSPGISPGISPQRSPQLSPHRAHHRPTNSAFSFEGSEHLGSNHGGSVGSGPNSRRGSVTAAENVLQVLDDSAWGESIRRSFTLRRPGAGSS